MSIRIPGLSAGIIHYVRSIYWYLRFPGKCYGCYRGVFESVEAAIAAAPKSTKIGYNHADLAHEYREQLSSEIGSYDYPVLFWLKDLLKPGFRVFDFGGNVGIHFYTYERYLKYPPDLKWIVCELAEIVAVGEQLAKENNRTELEFTEKFEQADGSNIFIASGSVQYIGSLSDLLLKLPQKPPHLLINRLPMCQGKTFITLQNGGLVFYPVYVFNQEEFINSITSLGYQLVDLWRDRSEPCSVPFHPEFSSMTFHGCYFRLKN